MFNIHYLEFVSTKHKDNFFNLISKTNAPKKDVYSMLMLYVFAVVPDIFNNIDFFIDLSDNCNLRLPDYYLKNQEKWVESWPMFRNSDRLMAKIGLSIYGLSFKENINISKVFTELSDYYLEVILKAYSYRYNRISLVNNLILSII